MSQRRLFLLLLLASPPAAQDGAVTLWTREVVRSSKLSESRAIFVATYADRCVGRASLALRSVGGVKTNARPAFL
jgi:hypothetical protein